LGSDGNLLAGNTVNLPQHPVSPPGDYWNNNFARFRSSTEEALNSRSEEIIRSENFSDVVYHLPLSFGVTVKKELNRTFAVESGIVYSYLSSTFNNESPKSKADLQLHYIGVPLNLHTRIFGDRFSQWEVYLSAGGMVEKGVLSHYVQKTYYDNSFVTIKSDEKIKGLQWSVGVSPGVDYQVHKNYSIYLEPRLSYYFDNNQPRSARTERNLTVGINAGVRYLW
jgi:hypothetical protein